MILQAGYLDVGTMIINGEVCDASLCHRDAAFYLAFSDLRGVRVFRLDPPIVQPNYSHVSPKLEDGAGNTGSG